MGASAAMIRLFGVLFASALTAACGGTSNTDALNVAVIGYPDESFENGSVSLASQITRAATAEGLVAFDAEGRIIPALAERWIVTDDGRSYIFRVRDGTWRDGTEITSRSVSLSLQGAVRSLRNTALGLDLAGIEEIREMAGQVVEIRLIRPMPHLLQLLAQPELGLLHDGESAGPMRLERDGRIATFSPIAPQDLGLLPVDDWEDRVRSVNLASMSGAEAVQRFNRGQVDLVLGGSIIDFPLTASVGILRGTIQLDPVDGLLGLRVVTDDGFLAEPANREAISMAIDRAGLIAPFGLAGWSPATRIVPPNLEGDLGTIGERWAEMTLENRRELAAARVARWQEGRADQAEEKDENEEQDSIGLRLWLGEGPGADILFGRLSQDLAAVGLTAERATSEKTADLLLIDEVARYPRAAWFLNRLNCGIREALCQPSADARVAEAREASDPAERAALLAEAEAELTEEDVFIPFGPPIRWSLVRGDVRGFATNRWGWHPLMPMAVLPR